MLRLAGLARCIRTRINNTNETFYFSHIASCVIARVCQTIRHVHGRRTRCIDSFRGHANRKDAIDAIDARRTRVNKGCELVEIDRSGSNKRYDGLDRVRRRRRRQAGRRRDSTNKVGDFSGEFSRSELVDILAAEDLVRHDSDESRDGRRRRGRRGRREDKWRRCLRDTGNRGGRRRPRRTRWPWRWRHVKDARRVRWQVRRRRAQWRW